MLSISNVFENGDVWRLYESRVLSVLCAPNVCVSARREWTTNEEKKTKSACFPSFFFLFSHMSWWLFIAWFIMHSSKAVFVGGLVCFKPNQFCFRLFILFFCLDWCENKVHHIVHILSSLLSDNINSETLTRWTCDCDRWNDTKKEHIIQRKSGEKLMKWIMQYEDD